MSVELADDEVRELRELLLDLHCNPRSGPEIHAMGGLRSVLGRSLLDKLGVEVPEDAGAELLYEMGRR